MSDDLTAMLDALADDAQAAARLGTGADIRRRARRQTHRAYLGAGTLTAAVVALVLAVASTFTGGLPGPATSHSPTTAPTGSPSPLSSAPAQSFTPDPTVYHPEAWLPAADAPMAPFYQWTVRQNVINGPASVAGGSVIPVCGSQYNSLTSPEANVIGGSTQVRQFIQPGGNTIWSLVLEKLHFLPSAQDAATIYNKLLPDLGRCLGDTSGFGADTSAAFTAHTANGFGWYQQYLGQPSVGGPRIAVDHILVARQGSVLAIFEAVVTWAPGGHGPAYDTSGDQKALDSLVAHLAVYAGPASSPSASGS